MEKRGLDTIWSSLTGATTEETLHLTHLRRESGEGLSCGDLVLAWFLFCGTPKDVAEFAGRRAEEAALPRAPKDVAEFEGRRAEEAAELGTTPREGVE